MSKSQDIEINPARRILRWESALSGSIFTGTEKIRSGYGNGDCLFFDFYHRVFALADGSERFSRASREILSRLSQELSLNGVPGTAGEWKSLINSRIYPAQKYQHKTTFSCVAIRGDENGIVLIIAHGGDSTVMVVDSENGEVLFQTDRNMVFAGRSQEIVDVIEYPVTSHNIRVIISSDGLEDLSRFCSRQLFPFHFPEACVTLPVDRICERMERVLGENSGLFEHDDIALIALDPFQLFSMPARNVLIGGTQPYEEKLFRMGVGVGDLDLWGPHEIWASAEMSFAVSGITLH
jgi:hypothetical protein